jgi:hypothetical protein
MKLLVVFVALLSVNAMADVGVMKKSEINASSVLCKEEQAKLLRKAEHAANNDQDDDRRPAQKADRAN